MPILRCWLGGVEPSNGSCIKFLATGREMNKNIDRFPSICWKCLKEEKASSYNTFFYAGSGQLYDVMC